MKALSIGNDEQTTEMASLSLRIRWPDCAIHIAKTLEEGLRALRHQSFDVLILHSRTDHVPLSRIVKEVRQLSDLPLLVLSRREEEFEIVGALEMGADEYVRLPCDLPEMMIRIWALLRRTGHQALTDGEHPLISGPLLVNPATYEVALAGKRLILTSTEFRVLYTLINNQGTVVTHQSLEQSIWGSQSVEGSGLEKKYIQRLRQKLGDNARAPCWIASVHGVGYRFIGPSAKRYEPLELEMAASA